MKSDSQREELTCLTSHLSIKLEKNECMESRREINAPIFFFCHENNEKATHTDFTKIMIVSVALTGAPEKIRGGNRNVADPGVGIEMVLGGGDSPN